MYKLAVALVIGVVLGSIVTFQLKPAPSGSGYSAPPVRDIQNVPDISIAEAEAHRRDRYESIETIEDVLALPTDFAEIEALYVIAGRADSPAIQDLVYQAARISDRTDRNAALGILLTRLTELDPYSALAIARDPALGGVSVHESSVWRTWGRLDFDEALYAAQQGSYAERNNAAQALYISIRDLDAEKSERISSTLGIKPGRNVRGQQIYALADKSVADAIRFIESQSTIAEQREQMGWLAQYLSQSSRVAPADYSELIRSPANRAMFERSMAAYGTHSDPEEVLDKYLAQPGDQTRQMQAYAALQSLAQQDPDKAFAYLGRFPNHSVRQQMANIVVTSLAATDPQRALAWARENQGSSSQSMLAAVFAQIAQHDPQLAISEAQSIQNSATREQSIGMIVSVVSQNSPSDAAEMLHFIADASTRRNLISQLGQQWVVMDFEAATQWVSSLSADDQRLALQGMGQRLAYSDVDRAIALLNQFPDGGPRNMKMQIAQGLAQQRSVEAAQAFIEKYKGTREYPRLQMAVISSLASSDPDRAMQMAGSIPDEKTRNQLYASIVSQKANDDPRLALQWMESISDEGQRQIAMSKIVMIWNSRNPGEASNWAKSQPRGAARDAAIVMLTMGRPQHGQDARQLIDTIDDPAMRKQAMLGLVQRMIYSDSQEAERLLNTMDLNDDERSRYQEMIENTNYNGHMFDLE